MAAAMKWCSVVADSTPSNLAKRMATRGGISVTQAEQIADEITSILRNAVLAGEVVSLRRFGVIRTTRLNGEAWDPQRKLRVGRSKRVVRFKPSKEF